MAPSKSLDPEQFEEVCPLSSFAGRMGDRIALARGDPEKALGHLRIPLNTGDPEARMLDAQALLELKQLQEALKHALLSVRYVISPAVS